MCEARAVLPTGPRSISLAIRGRRLLLAHGASRHGIRKQGGASTLPPPMQMKITIGQLTFDNASYDASRDVLYLHVGEPQAAAESEETPEQHVVRFDQDGQVIGLTIINA